MGHVVVAGGDLPGLAAAARLAKAGHAVTQLCPDADLGGPYARAGVLPPVWTFPAPLRDLFRKSGRAFDPELARAGLTLEPAPPARHTFADGTTFDWPTDRGEQWHLLHDRYGPAVATRWRDLVDEAAEVWQLLRPLGLEAEFTDRSQLASRHRILRPSLTLADLARHLDHPHLAALVTDVAHRIGSDPARTPSFLVSRLAVERTFGRWRLVDAAGAVDPRRVLGLIEQRLATRGVRIERGVVLRSIAPHQVETADATLDADAVVTSLDPWALAALTSDRPSAPLAARLRLRRLAPAAAPTVTLGDPAPADAPLEHVRHTPRGPVVTYALATAAGPRLVTHDHTRPTPDPRHGLAWAGAGSWLRRPALQAPDGLVVASAAARGGNEPWAQLLTGALATYAVHGRLTGEDIRPVNRDYKP